MNFMSTLLEVPPTSLATPSLRDIWYTRCPVPTPFGLALQLGWIEEEFAGESDVVFRALQTSSDPKVHQSHYTHTQPRSFRHGGNFPAIWAQSNGAGTRVIGLSWVHSPQLVVARPGSGIKSAADLKGKRLLAVRRPKEDIDFAYGMALRTYEIALAGAGLTLADAEIVDIPIDRSLVSDRFQPGSPEYVTFNKNPRKGRGSEGIWGLLEGKGDVLAVYNSQLIEILGLDEVFNSDSVPLEDRANSSTPLTFAVKADIIEERPDLVARIYARALQAVEWAQNNPGEALRLVAREQGQSEFRTEAAFGNRFLASLTTDLDPNKIKALHTAKNFLLGRGIIPRNFDVDTWVDPRPLEAALSLVENRRKNFRYQSQVAPGTNR
jgi:ABC-type nitrate/sulfonate/bicarbonate transport system substrate-binding protein